MFTLPLLSQADKTRLAFVRVRACNAKTIDSGIVTSDSDQSAADEQTNPYSRLRCPDRADHAYGLPMHMCAANAGTTIFQREDTSPGLAITLSAENNPVLAPTSSWSLPPPLPLPVLPAATVAFTVAVDDLGGSLPLKPDPPSSASLADVCGGGRELKLRFSRTRRSACVRLRACDDNDVL